MLNLLYDPSAFQRFAEHLSTKLGSYLERARTEPHRAIEPRAAAEMVADAAQLLQSPGSFPLDADEIIRRAEALLQPLLTNSTRLHSPHYMGHQVNPPIPIAGAMSLVSGILNQGLAIFEMSQFTMGVERALIGKLGNYVGWKPGEYDGIVTSGGTLANLTAILAARNWKYPQSWKSGLGSARPALFAGEDSHYSIARSAGMLGLGTDQIIVVPLDDRRRMHPDALALSIRDARLRGLDPFCVVAASGSTPVGAFDPLPEIATVAEKENLWLHVDAAHGGSLLLNPSRRSLLNGVDRADSITWDAHKLMFVPSLCTFLLYRDRADSYLPFQQEAPYIFRSGEAPAEDTETGRRTFECTKGAIATPVWAVWSIFGDQVFAELTEKVITTTQLFHQRVEEADDFTALHQPECNIFCFRYTPSKFAGLGPLQLSQAQQSIRERLVADGRFYITGTTIDGVYSLRVTVMNPFTGREHIDALLDAIREGSQSYPMPGFAHR